MTLRFWCRNRCIAIVASAEATEKGEWAAVPASSLFSVSFPQSTRHLHLIAALLADPLVTSESSTPHTEPAMDGRSLLPTTTTPTVFFL